MDSVSADLLTVPERSCWARYLMNNVWSRLGRVALKLAMNTRVVVCVQESIALEYW